MSSPLCFFLGDGAAFNLRQLADNIVWMLNDGRPLHLITSNKHLYQSLTDRTTVEVFGDNSGSLWRSVNTLRTYLESYDPGVVVQLTDPPVHGSIVTMLGRRTGTPTTYRYAGDRFAEHRVAKGRERITALAIGSALGRLPLRLATTYVSLGPVGKDRLVSRGVDPDSVKILPPSIDMARFEDIEAVSEWFEQDRKVILTVGRMTRLKGAKSLERIIRRVLERDQNYHFVHVGPTREELNIPREYAPHVTLVGMVQPRMIPSYMAAGSMLLHPSLSEGVPRVLLEALAAGTPVLARGVGDVASVTKNTFTSEDECVEMICAEQELPIDEVAPFSREVLAPRYQAFFHQFQ